nr:hypothetical protein pmam_418 [Pithovirus mammoth]
MDFANLWTVCDKNGKQYNGGRGFYVFKPEFLNSFYDSRGLEEFVCRVRLPSLDPSFQILCKREGWFLVNKVEYEGEKLSLLRPETYFLLNAKPHPKFIQKALISHAANPSDDVSILDNWWKEVYSDKGFFSSYLDFCFQQEKISVLNFWAEKCWEENLPLHLWQRVQNFCRNSPILLDWIFKFGISHCDFTYCRIALRQAISKDPCQLLQKWKTDLFELCKVQSQPFPPPVSRALKTGNVRNFFTYQYGGFNSMNFDLNSVSAFGKASDLELVFNEAAYFEFSALTLDKTSEEGNISCLKWWVRKAQRYGPQFLPYSKALDLAASRGHLEILNIWLQASKKLGFELRYSSNLCFYAAIQSRLDILDWWKEAGCLHLPNSIFPILVRASKIDVLKWFSRLERSKRSSIDFASLDRMLSGSFELKQWWFLEGRSRFSS